MKQQNESKKNGKTKSQPGILDVPEMDVRGKTKDYPSITDYYKAASRGEKPIQYQHGLSNYSCVQLGDDRIAFKKSLSQDVYRRDDIEQTEKLVSTNFISEEKTFKQRKEDYSEANKVVGLEKIHEMEQMMRDKLQQRTKTGPFQLRKTFKYFDRDGSGGIDFSEFQRAMELMGFQFTEMQQLALFARYDESCNGEVDYNDFVEKVMESDFKVVNASYRKSLDNMVSSVFAHKSCDMESDDDSSDSEDDSRLNSFREKEIKKLFDVIDRDSSGFIEKKEIDLLLELLGRKLTTEQIEKGFRRLDKDHSGRIDFREFLSFFNSMSR